MITEFRRRDLEQVKTADEVRNHLKAQGTDRDSLYPQMVGWLESQQNRLVQQLKEAYDEIDSLKAKLDEIEGIAEDAIGTEDGTSYAEYWDKHYAS